MDVFQRYAKMRFVWQESSRSVLESFFLLVPVAMFFFNNPPFNGVRGGIEDGAVDYVQFGFE
jgi:hypothetical protein